MVEKACEKPLYNIGMYKNANTDLAFEAQKANT